MTQLTDSMRSGARGKGASAPFKVVLPGAGRGARLAPLPSRVSEILAPVGEYLDRNWQRKRRLDARVTSPEIDARHERACNAGALGGKLLGPAGGGGGGVLFYVPDNRQPAVRLALRELRELPFELESGGSRSMHVGR